MQRKKIGIFLLILASCLVVPSSVYLARDEINRQILLDESKYIVSYERVFFLSLWDCGYSIHTMNNTQIHVSERFYLATKPGDDIGITECGAWNLNRSYLWLHDYYKDHDFDGYATFDDKYR